MKVTIQILAFVLILISCKSEKQKRYEKEIIGEWNYVKDIEVNKQENKDYDEPPPPFFANLGGFIFEKDGTLIDKIGFFDFDEKKSREDRKIRYIGDSTNYTINNDSLKILNPVNKKWSNYKIISISQDTLTLQKHSNYYIKYEKAKFKIDKDEKFDKIVISSSGCYGTCAIMSIEFNKNGEVYYLGEKYNLVNGSFTSKIKDFEYKIIENSFIKSNISELNSRYSAPVTDLNTISVTFFRDKKIIKTISDYGGQAPAEFIMAYRKAMYYYQKLHLNKIKLANDLPQDATFSIDKGNKHIFLSDSDRFLLFNLLQNGKKVSSNFNPIYKLTFYNENNYETENVIYSDGRFFKTSKSTYDIGYNFIKSSNLEDRDEPF